MSNNTEVQLTLDDAVQEVLGMLTGLDLTYEPQLDRYRSITRQLNRALRLNALEKEWSWYSSLLNLGNPVEGFSYLLMNDDQLRPRIINDDAIRFVDENGFPRLWAYFLPRDSLHKYAGRTGWWASVTHNIVEFNHVFTEEMESYEVLLPVMREPEMFRLPAEAEEEVDEEIRDQLVDFQYPDVVVGRAAYLYALTDPIMQPRAQTLEAQYKDLMYQVIERDDRNTDTPFNNEFLVPVQNGIEPESNYRPWPLSDNRR